MTFSITGVIVCATLLVIGYILRAPLIVALLSSLALGATAFAELTAIAGATPPIYTLFTLLFILSMAMHKRVIGNVVSVLTANSTGALICLLTVYAVVGAIILPRMFADQTTAFIPFNGRITEVALSPSSKNITQSAYFVLSAAAFFAFAVWLRQPRSFRCLKLGFYSFTALSIALGFLDLAGKQAGIIDLLAPIRTVHYALLTDSQFSTTSFWRVAGGQAEASAYGAYSLIGFAFCIVYWHRTGSMPALLLTIGILAMLLLSTSTTAYAGLAILALFATWSAIVRLAQGYLQKRDIIFVALVAIFVIIVIYMYIFQLSIINIYVKLFQESIVNKIWSTSAQERFYWNYKSILSVSDTYGLGIGLGSSRSSSWIISVITQLGVAGALVMFYLVFQILNGLRGISRVGQDREITGVASGARSAAIASMVASSISGGEVDPGVTFFVALAAIGEARRQLALQQPVLQRGSDGVAAARTQASR